VTERERFEAWYAAVYPELFFPELQSDAAKEKAWQAWHAAKDEVAPILNAARKIPPEGGYLEELTDAADEIIIAIKQYDEGVQEHVNQ
jgi:hypothetical protein